jgi:hypothetical protein
MRVDNEMKVITEEVRTINVGDDGKDLDGSEFADLPAHVRDLPCELARVAHADRLRDRSAQMEKRIAFYHLWPTDNEALNNNARKDR